MKWLYFIFLVLGGISSCIENRKGDFDIGNSVSYTWSYWYLHWWLYWSMNCKHSTGFWLLLILILIRWCLRMLLNLILYFKILTWLSVNNIQLIYMEEYGILYLILQIASWFFSTITLQWPLCSFFPNLIIIYM